MTDHITSIITTDKAVATDEIRLSICLRTNGFSFSTMTMGHELLTFGEAAFDLHRPFCQLPQTLKKFFDESGIQTFGCKEVRLVVPSEQCVWIPKHLYDAAYDRQYLKMVTDVGGGVGVVHAYNECVGAYMVFTAPAEVVTAFKVAIPGVEVVCQHSVLVDERLKESSAQHPIVLMHVRERVGDFEAFYNKQLLLSNSYTATDEGELVYRALEVMKGMHLETPDMELAICGEVGRELYARLQRYFPNVTLYTGRSFSYSNPKFQTFHSYRHVLVL